MPVNQKKTPRSRSTKTPGRRTMPPVERYSDERVAEFLLSNTVDAEDYARAVKLVRRMGLDPAKIDHDKPIGAS
jgi:hypothetical protein